ncbi:MAG: choice-of-anchor R domain-containing protein [Bryobacteraceae bacterium]
MSKLWLACGGILLASSLQAGTIYDDVLAAPSGVDSIETDGPLYDSFSTGASSGTLSNVELLLYAGGAADGPITVGLYSDNGTTPGSLIAVLETFDDSTLRGGFQLVTLVLAANPGLSAETRYWIGVFGETADGWAYTTDTSGTGVAGEYYSNSGGTSQNEDGGGFQMEVGITPAPEPSTFFASMLFALAMFRRATRPLQR